MKLPQFSRTSSPPKMLNTNLSHPTSTDTMPLNVPFNPSRTISLQVWPPLTQTFLSPNVVGSYPKWTSPSIYFAHPDSTPNSLPTHNLKEPLTSTKPSCPTWHPCHCTQEALTMLNMGTPWHRWLVRWSHPQALPMPPHLDPQHTIRMHCQHTPVLSNSPPNPNALPSRCHNPSCTRTQPCLETTTQ